MKNSSRFPHKSPILTNAWIPRFPNERFTNAFGLKFYPSFDSLKKARRTSESAGGGIVKFKNMINIQNITHTHKNKIRKVQSWNLIKHQQLIFWKFLLIYIDLFKNKTLIYFTKNKNKPFYIFTQKHQLIQTMIFYIYFCKKFVWYHTNFFSSKMRYDYKLKKTEKHLFHNFDSLL